ncbi:MAG TPA: hypothetical protein VFH61_10470 [Thermoleophilia bacterium]|nr:hypothetical protein [Thermoleophilia bacterium]
MSAIAGLLALALTVAAPGPPQTEAGHHCPCLSAAQVRDLAGGWPDWDKDALVWLAGAEASLSAPSGKIYYFGAVNVNEGGSVDRCGWQVNSIHGFDAERLLTDPFYCAWAAHDVWERQGYQAWSTW